MATDSDQKSSGSYFVTVLGCFISLLIFVGLLSFAYKPEVAAGTDSKTQIVRKERLADVEAQQQELVTSYQWVNQSEGVVRIPVERAMALTVERLNKGK